MNRTGIRYELNAIFLNSKSMISKINWEHSEISNLSSSYLNRIFEQLSGVIYLLETKNYTSIYPVLRSAFEASADLNNLNKYDYYKTVLIKKKYGENYKMLSFIEENSESDIASIVYEKLGSENIINIIDTNKEMINDLSDELKKSGKKWNGVKQKILNSDYDKEGYIVYMILCGDTHNSIDSLNKPGLIFEARHIFRKTIDDDDYIRIIDVISTIIEKALIDIRRHIKNINEINYFKCSEGIGDFREELIRKF